MLSFTSLWLLSSVLLTAAPFETSTTLVYQGQIGPHRTEDNAPPANKTFDLTLLVSDASDRGAELFWLVDERGQGGWNWSERFGTLVLGANHQQQGPQGPALLYDYGRGKSVVPLIAPVLKVEQPIAQGTAWEEGQTSYRVEGSRRIADRDTWRITVSTPYGLKRTLYLDKGSELLVGWDERVFMDQGTEYRMQVRLGSTTKLDGADLASLSGAFEALVELRSRLKRPARSMNEELDSEHRAVLKASLPGLQQNITRGPLKSVVAAAQRDLEVQGGRAEALGSLEQKWVGQPIPTLDLVGLNKQPFTSEQLKGKVTVLHFWDYRDEPLKEPYGQVGYLEFLHAKRHADGLQVLGVAVDGRLAQENTRGAAVSGIRKLRSFMNLTYPIFLDEGAAIRSLGDPRQVGAVLPLFVVIGRDGKVAHYHVGHYAVDQQQGLKQLDQLVVELLK